MQCGVKVLLIALAIISQYLCADETKLYPLRGSIPIRVSGYVRHESFWDSRQVVGYRDDQYLLYPEKKLLDANCQDINAHGQFDMVAIQTRLHIDADGPKIGSTQSSAVIEADYIINMPIRTFSMRQLYINNIIFYKLGNHLRGDIAITDARATRLNYVYQGFSVTKPDTANLGYYRLNFSPR
jgi:hypothetical protein